MAFAFMFLNKFWKKVGAQQWMLGPSLEVVILGVVVGHVGLFWRASVAPQDRWSETRTASGSESGKSPIVPRSLFRGRLSGATWQRALELGTRAVTSNVAQINTQSAGMPALFPPWARHQDKAWFDVFPSRGAAPLPLLDLVAVEVQPWLKLMVCRKLCSMTLLWWGFTPRCCFFPVNRSLLDALCRESPRSATGIYRAPWTVVATVRAR